MAAPVALISTGGGLTFGQEIIAVMEDQMRQSGAPPEQIAEQSQQTRRLFEEVRREPSTQKEWGSDGKLARNTHLWLSRAAPVAAYRTLLRLDVPILVVHGAEDRSTPLASAQRLQEAFARAGKTNLELRIQAGGHDPSGKVIQETLKWVVEHSRKVDGFRRFSGLCA